MSFAMHQPPPGGFSYSGVPTPGHVLGMMAPTNGHASQTMVSQRQSVMRIIWCLSVLSCNPLDNGTLLMRLVLCSKQSG